MRRMATKGPQLSYTETRTHCQAVIPVRDVINIDAEHNRCPKCGEAYRVAGSEKLQRIMKLERLQDDSVESKGRIILYSVTRRSA